MPVLEANRKRRSVASNSVETIVSQNLEDQEEKQKHFKAPVNCDSCRRSLDSAVHQAKAEISRRPRNPVLNPPNPRKDHEMHEQSCSDEPPANEAVSEISPGHKPPPPTDFRSLLTFDTLQSPVGYNEGAQRPEEGDQGVEVRLTLQQSVQGGHPQWKIINWKLTDERRILEYRVRRREGNEEEWLAAVDMDGQEWTNEMSNFWSNKERAEERAHFERPNGDDPAEPGPFGRFILQAEIVEDREVAYYTRDFESGPGEDGIIDSEYWTDSSQLGNEWDPILEDFYLKGQLILDWSMRIKYLKRMGFIDEDIDERSIGGGSR